MKQLHSVIRACEVLRARVRYEGACLRLPGTRFEDTDTPRIQEATRLYVESWIMPIIDAIEAGDVKAMLHLTRLAKGREMDTP